MSTPVPILGLLKTHPVSTIENLKTLMETLELDITPKMSRLQMQSEIDELLKSEPEFEQKVRFGEGMNYRIYNHKKK